MTKFKNLTDNSLFYTDCDSVYLNKPLSEDLISNKDIGKLKLEHISNKAIFLGPKTYYLENTNLNDIIKKVKGLREEGMNELTFNDFYKLLFKNEKIEINNTKWFKSLTQGTLTIQNQIYTLTKTDTKREFIYDKDNKLIATKAIVLPIKKQ
jgi:hypothetical protein